MRTLVDLIDSVTSSVRFIFLLFFLAILGLGLIMTVGASVVAPAAVDSIGERAERVSNRAIEAAQTETRNAQLARDGWGYSDSVDANESDEFGEDAGGWAD
ncbi:MAG: hypothetical protein AAF941_04140 [Pseudomonadota bacterium]